MHATSVKLYNRRTQFPVTSAYLIGELWVFSARRDFFDYCTLQILLLTCLLADEFLVYLWQFYGKTHARSICL